MIVDQLAQRWLIHLMQDITEHVRFCAILGKIGSIGLPQGADQGVPMLSADLAVLIAMALKGHGRPPDVLVET
jgi:hypothetical protein